MSFKVYDFDCTCGAHLVDVVVKEEQGIISEADIPICEECSLPMRRMFPAPAGYVHDRGQVANKKAIARAFRAKSKVFSSRPGSIERKEAQKEHDALIGAGTT